jgi:hypothetical protein
MPCEIAPDLCFGHISQGLRFAARGEKKLQDAGCQVLVTLTMASGLQTPNIKEGASPVK